MRRSYAHSIDTDEGFTRRIPHAVCRDIFPRWSETFQVWFVGHLFKGIPVTPHGGNDRLFVSTGTERIPSYAYVFRATVLKAVFIKPVERCVRTTVVCSEGRLAFFTDHAYGPGEVGANRDFPGWNRSERAFPAYPAAGCRSGAGNWRRVCRRSGGRPG